MKHTNALCGQNVEFFSVKQGGMYIYHCAVQDQVKIKLKFKTTSK
jgi:hypothetical protein